VPIEIGLNPVNSAEGAFVLASIIDISERKRSEEDLRKSEERLQTIIENLSEGLVLADLDGQLLHWNQPGLTMFGFSNMEEALLKLPQFQEILELSTLDGAILKLEDWPLPRIIGGEHLVGYELCLRRIDKDWKRVFSYGGTIVSEPNGQSLAFVTFTDITESKQAEENLRRSQEQLAGIIGSAMDAVITIDDAQRIILFNGAAERMFLFPADDAIGQPLDRFIPERFRAAHQQHVHGFGETHVTRRSMGALGALYGMRADGEEFPIEASISQIESDGQKLYTVILRDVSERRRSEEALKEQARILDLAPVLIRDLNGRILFWNTGAEKMYGWTAAEALEQVTHHLFRTVFPRPEEEIKARLLSRGHWEGELIHNTKDGRQLVIASHWVLHRDEQGKPKAILEVNNDVTERKHAEREVRRLNEELEQRVADRTAQLQAANKELEAFSYSVSHDLRAPLRHINGFSQALLEDYADRLDDGGKEYLNEVRSASQEMAKLIDDLLQLARVTRGEMRREEVNLSELAHSVIEELKKINGKRNVAIEIKEGLKARGDKRLLRVMLTNLLGNAWKFTSHRDQAEVSLGQTRQNGESFYFVRDNGAGFDMTYANKLFGAFQRLHTAGEFEGTGIGLATVQRIITRHGGRVWAEGTVNEGATFYFTLPNSRETEDGQQSDPAG
ncbi:MAG TPA: PAS domain S-box protein, partial [Pyrinomonadaceae bacterium]